MMCDAATLNVLVPPITLVVLTLIYVWMIRSMKV